jgi:hypothetical protein
MKNDTAKYDNSKLSIVARLMEALCSLLFCDVFSRLVWLFLEPQQA